MRHYMAALGHNELKKAWQQLYFMDMYIWFCDPILTTNQYAVHLSKLHICDIDKFQYRMFPSVT